MDDVADGRSGRRLHLMVAAGVVTVALVGVAIALIAGESDDKDGLVSNPRLGEFLFDEPVLPDPDRRSRVLAVNPMSGEVLWATDVPGHSWSFGFAQEGIVLPYSGQLRGTPGVIGLGYDGTPGWQATFRIEGPNAPSFVHLDNGDLLAAPSKWSPARGPQQIARIDGNTGELVWSTTLGFSPDDIEVVGDRAILLQATVGFVGVDLTSGALLWETEFEETKWLMPPAIPVEQGKRSSDDTVYFSLAWQGRSGIVGVTTAGEITLEIEVPWQTEIIRLDGEAMITMKNPRTLSRYSAQTGELVWSRNGLAQTMSYETIGDTALIRNGTARRLLGVSVETGETLWRLDSDQSRKMTSNDDERFYVWNGSDEGNTLVAIDAASGSEQWTFRAGGLLRGEAPTRDGVVYAATRHRAPGLAIDGSQGVFAALDAVTGAELWALDLDFGFEAMTIHDDVLYIVTTLN